MYRFGNCTFPNAVIQDSRGVLDSNENLSSCMVFTSLVAWIPAEWEKFPPNSIHPDSPVQSVL